MKHNYFFVGTTAELIKVMPVIQEFKRRSIPFKIISSGQHEIALGELEPIFGKTKIDIAFPTKSNLKKSSIINFTLWVFRAFVNCALGLRQEFKGLNKSNSCFIVHGDTVSSLVGASVARLYGLKVAHVESGLRSFSFLEPFPEEICRCVVSYLSDIHFCPNSWAMNNLKTVPGLKIDTKRNTVIESLYKAIEVSDKFPLPAELKKQKYFMLMLHRQEHVFFQKRKSRDIFEQIFKSIPKDTKCVVIMHALTKNFLKNEGLLTSVMKNTQIVTIPRQPYGVFAGLMKSCEFIITDGGSTQEEAYFLGKPCLIIRNRTERVEGLNKNALLAKSVKNNMADFIKDYNKHSAKSVNINPRPSKIILDYLVKQKVVI